MAKSTSTSKKKKKGGTTKSVKAVQSKGKGKKSTKKKIKKIPEISREAVKEARVQIEQVLMQLHWENAQDRERVKALLSRIREMPSELGFTPEQMKLAKEYGADRVWWIDTMQKCERREDVLKRQIEFVEHYKAVGAKITLAVEAMRRAHGGAPVICPQTISTWKKNYPDFRKALFFCLVRDYEVTIQALRAGVLKGNPTLIIFDSVNKSKQVVKEAGKMKQDGVELDFVDSLPRYENIQKVEYGASDDTEDVEIRTTIRRKREEKKGAKDGSETK